MKIYDNFCVPDKGKQFVITKLGKTECASCKSYEIGEQYDDQYYVPKWMVEDKFVEEVDIPGWTKMKGYEVVYYHKGIRLSAGNPQCFPLRSIAESYKKHYESYPWFDDELFIEEIETEGIPLSEYEYYDGKEVIDKEHYFGLAAHEVGTYFTEEMVNYFMDLLPPVCMRNDCSQIGEPVSSRIDEKGNGRTTYSTFKKIADRIWEYCGDCFKGENYQHGKEL